jgi:hypothetical protein
VVVYVAFRRGRAPVTPVVLQEGIARKRLEAGDDSAPTSMFAVFDRVVEFDERRYFAVGCPERRKVASDVTGIWLQVPAPAFPVIYAFPSVAVAGFV